MKYEETLADLPDGIIVRHKGRGTLYRLVRRGTMQAADNPLDEQPCVIYQDIEQPAKWWCRPAAEFYDGRFEPAEYNADDDMALIVAGMADNFEELAAAILPYQAKILKGEITGREGTVLASAAVDKFSKDAAS